MSALVPYAGRFRRPITLPYMAYESPFGSASAHPPMKDRLDVYEAVQALSMFRRGVGDTKEIAWQLEATEAAAANGIAWAREQERAA